MEQDARDAGMNPWIRINSGAWNVVDAVELTDASSRGTAGTRNRG